MRWKAPGSQTSIAREPEGRRERDLSKCEICKSGSWGEVAVYSILVEGDRKKKGREEEGSVRWVTDGVGCTAPEMRRMKTSSRLNKRDF